jgi:hypothetical protein
MADEKDGNKSQMLDYIGPRDCVCCDRLASKKVGAYHYCPDHAYLGEKRDWNDHSSIF